MNKIISNTNVFQKILTSSDDKEFEQTLEYNILKSLISKSNQYESYQKAIDEVQLELQQLITTTGQRAKIKKVAERAGEMFLKSVHLSKKNDNKIKRFNGFKGFKNNVEFGNVTVSVGEKNDNSK